MAKKNYPFFEIEIGKNFSKGISTNVDWEPSTNIIETKNHLIIEIELPGVNKEDVSILLQSNRELIIKGVKKQPKIDKEQVAYYLFEREFGNFYKHIVIDISLNTSNIKSAMDNGVLTVEIAKKKNKIISVDIK